ncbi:LysM peptidoglycan-binding domain-containing protein [Scytonema sp. PCC 10023]|uniref:LysM peptidoglycan-binding domain-containing protein n=1 Tax=Scytonema sp. PCC 10023 TaxID=1680591 RepID=UPI0039C71FA8
MVNTQDIRFKKSGGGLVSQSPLSETHPRAANPLSLTRPHATAASTLVKPQPSAPSRAPAVSLRSGDTLWEVAQKKLGDGTRWRELQKADGSQFTRQEAKHLQVGTQVYLPGVKMTMQTPHPVTLGSSTPRVPTQILRPEGITRREFTPGSTPSTKSTQFSASPALVSRTSQVSLNLLSAEGTMRREYTNGSSHPTRSTGSRDSSDTWNNALINGTVKGIAVGTRIANRLTRTSLPQTNSLDAKRAIGKITEKVWNEHFDSRSDIVRNIRQTTWKDRNTRKTLQFPDAKSRRPDNFIQLNNGRGIAVEVKGTPLAAETSEASRQRVRDRIALSKQALLGNKNKGFHEVDRAITKVGLPILGPGGNTALPGETQKHVIIKPKGGAQPLPSTWTERVKSLGGYKDSATYVVRTRGGNRSVQTRTLQAARTVKEPRVAKRTLQAARTVGESRAAQGVLRGASRVAAPVAVGLDAWRLKDAYHKDGFGQEFRKTAGSVAGGWGGAAAGAAIGSFAGPPGMIVGGIIGGVAGSEFGDDIEQGAEKAGKAIADGAKKAWNKLFG